MSVLSFESHPVTTMTLVIPLVGTVNLDAAFGLLPITRLNLPQPKRQPQKYKIPHCGNPGAIFSLRYKGYVRGIIRSHSTKPFKNSITIDIATEKKNVSIKLSSTKIQMCGASSVEQGAEGANHIIQALLAIQDQLDYIQANRERAQATLEWIKTETRGVPIERADEGGKTDHQLRAVSTTETEVPPTIDGRIVSFLLRQQPDFLYHSDFCSELDWILTLKQVTTRPLEIQQVCKAMVNYNYDLGFHIDRYELVTRINGLNGFYARYDNAVEHNVTIELPYEVPANHRAMRRKNKHPCHTFLVYMSGLVTQSGPGEELMREAYYRFNATINSIREHIMKPDIPRSLKYRKVPSKPEATHERLVEHRFPNFSETGELSPNSSIELSSESSTSSVTLDSPVETSNEANTLLDDIQSPHHQDPPVSATYSGVSTLHHPRELSPTSPPICQLRA
jgi:hypothetical protein